MGSGTRTTDWATLKPSPCLFGGMFKCIGKRVIERINNEKAIKIGLNLCNAAQACAEFVSVFPGGSLAQRPLRRYVAGLVLDDLNYFEHKLKKQRMFVA